MNRFCRTALTPLLVLLWTALLLQPSAADVCGQQTHAGNGYTVCVIDPADADLRLFWEKPDGGPYRSFAAVADELDRTGETLVFGINAGMYRDDFSPIGLYVEAGEERRPANLQEVTGPPARIPNFYKQPNGIFFLTASGAGILPTEAYLEQRPEARYATQSGPMLVIDGALHPAFIEGSSDRTRRSGVGVCADGEVRFAISDGQVNFHDFARLFRDQLGCSNALFLDGGRGTGLYDPALRRNDFSWHGGFGPMFGLVR